MAATILIMAAGFMVMFQKIRWALICLAVSFLFIFFSASSKYDHKARQRRGAAPLDCSSSSCVTSLKRGAAVKATKSHQKIDRLILIVAVESV